MSKKQPVMDVSLKFLFFELIDNVFLPPAYAVEVFSSRLCVCVCVSVCLSVRAITFEWVDIETSFVLKVN